MRTVSLGPLGRVPALGLGFWQAGGRMWRSLGGDWIKGVIEEAVLQGIRLLDTAEIYGWGRSEELLGRAMRELGLRDEVLVSSKIPPHRSSPDRMERAAKGIALRLGRRPDLILLHWPPPVWKSLCKYIRGLERLVDKGLAGSVGVSNFPARLLEEALHCPRRHELVANQVQYSLAYRSPENSILPLARRHGIAVMAWSPLAKGALAGSGRPVDPAQKRDPVYRVAARDTRLQDALDRASKAVGAPRSVVALAWLIAKGAMPIPGTRRRERVREYAQALSLELPESVMRELDKASSVYLERWGREYKALQWLRLVPLPLQYLVLRLQGGV